MANNWGRQGAGGNDGQITTEHYEVIVNQVRATKLGHSSLFRFYLLEKQERYSLSYPHVWLLLLLCS
jgi:hypothetical protein